MHACFSCSKPIIARCVLQENEDGNDDNQFLPSSQTRDHFLVCCLVRLLAHPKLERGRPLLFRARLRPFRDADCRSTFLGWSRGLGERFIPGKPRRAWLTAIATVVCLLFFAYNI